MSNTEGEPPKTAEAKAAVVEPKTGAAAAAPAANNAAAGTASSTAAKIEPPKSKGWSNPALKAMEIPAIRFPSRNWMIFWMVTSGLVGGIVYDKYQQQQLRKKWMDRVAEFGAKPLKPNELSRKITIYIAPPPNDFLDESMAVFRKYIKPILNAGGVDFEIKSEGRQGVIRSTVAADIRHLRREILHNEQDLKELEIANKWYNRVKRWVLSRRSSPIDEEALAKKKFTDDLEMKNVLGVFYNNIHKDDKTISEDSFISDPAGNGGVLCIGRGAFKEYIHGIHEGLLGPVEKPLDHREFEELKTDVKPPAVQSIDDVENKTNVDPVEAPVDAPVETSVDTSAVETSAKVDTVDETEQKDDKPDEGPKSDNTSEDEKPDQLPIPKPFISSEDYAKAQLAPEFKFKNKIPTTTHVSPFFQQPILVIPVYHLQGFLNFPIRLYRFYTRRYLTDEYGRLTAALVEGNRRKFTEDDLSLALGEEDEWPKKWVEAGKEKGSEWTQDMVVDDRITSKLTVYDDSYLK